METTGSLALADYLIIGGFFAVMLGIGCYYRGRISSTSAFFAGGKSVPWWIGGVSFYMVSFSALAFVMHSEMAYKYGLVSFALSWMCVPAAALSALLFARRWRRVADTSPLEYIEARYGAGMRQSLVWLGLPTRLLDDSLKLFAIGTVVSAGLGFPFRTGVVVCAAIIVAYTFMGGLWAAMVADFVQMVILLAVVLVLPVLAFREAGGVAHVMELIPRDFFRFTQPASGYPAAYLLCYFCLLFLNYSTSWALAQRYYSSQSDRDARKVGLLVAGLYVVGTPIFYVPAVAALVFLPHVANTKDVYPLICRSVLPIGMLGMVVAALFAATMSTLAGDYNAVSAVLTNDVYKRVFGRNANEKMLMMIGRATTVLVGAVVAGMTCVMRELQGSGDLFNTMAKVFGLFLPPVAIPMLLGMLTPRLSSRGAQVALWTGIVSGLCAFVAGQWNPTLRSAEFLTSCTAGVALLVFCLGSWLWPDRGDRRQQVLRFFDQVRTARPQTTGQPASAVSYLAVIASAIAAVGVTLVAAVTLTGHARAGRLSLGIGCALLLVAAAFWSASRHSRCMDKADVACRR